MASDSQRTRIQAALIGLAQEGEFYAVSYDKDSKLPVPVIRGTSATLTPEAVHANETGGAFDLDKNQGRELLRRRTKWTFDLYLGFNAEALLDYFLDTFKRPPVLKSDGDLPPVMLMLDSFQVNHGVTQQSSSGSSAVLHITATEGRETRPQ